MNALCHSEYCLLISEEALICGVCDSKVLRQDGGVVGGGFPEHIKAQIYVLQQVHHFLIPFHEVQEHPHKPAGANLVSPA